MQEIRSSNSPVVTAICDPNKSRAWHHSSLKPGSKIKYLNIDQLLNVILKASYCEIFKNLKVKNKMGTISLMQWINSYNKHESDCLWNHEGLESVSENLLCYSRKYFWAKYFASKNNCQ